MTTQEKLREGTRSWVRRSAAVFVASLIAAAAGASSAVAQTESLLYSFTGGSDGGNPSSGLTFDSSGNLYGTALSGGASGAGTVFKLPAGGTSVTVLYALPGTNGALPSSAPVFDSCSGKCGNILGTAEYNTAVGTGDGMVYQLTPTGTGSYTATILHSFLGTSTDGANPIGGVTIVPDGSGNFYGATYSGGASNDGTLYKLTPNGSGSYTYSPAIYSFSGGTTNGAHPAAGPTLNAAGSNLYGTTALGDGTLNTGSMFQYVLSTGVATFSGFNTVTNSGTQPVSSVILDSSGNIYGTTEVGGASSYGVVYKFTPNGLGGYTYSTLHTFTGGTTDGAYPISGLIFDSSGNLYGTTFQGGMSGYGTAFELSPSGSSYSETILHSFAGGLTDGAYPRAGLIFDSSGNLYGTTDQGGASGDGTIFEIMPAAALTKKH